MPESDVVPSPCTRVCRLDRRGVCEGCARTAEEIGRWTSMSPDEQRSVLAAAARRRAQQEIAG